MALFGRFHCPGCGLDTAEHYPSSGEFDYFCPGCGETTRYNVVSLDEVSFTCPICSEVHDCVNFAKCFADFVDKEMSFLVVVI